MKYVEAFLSGALLGIVLGLIVIAVLMLTGCASHRPPLHIAGNVTRIQYSSKNCREVPGRPDKVMCQDVLFTLGKVDAKDLVK